MKPSTLIHDHQHEQNDGKKNNPKARRTFKIKYGICAQEPAEEKLKDIIVVFPHDLKACPTLRWKIIEIKKKENAYDENNLLNKRPKLVDATKRSYIEKKSEDHRKSFKQALLMMNLEWDRFSHQLQGPVLKISIKHARESNTKSTPSNLKESLLPYMTI